MIDMPFNPDDYFRDDSIRNIEKLTTEIYQIIKTNNNIVRCKDCKYWQKSKIKGSRDYHTCMCVRLGKEGIIAFADDFCSRGDKK